MGRCIIGIIVSCLIALWCMSSAQARPWKGGVEDPAPKRPAQYYSIINDTHKKGEMVILIWLSAPFVGPAIEKMPGAQEALDKCIVIGFVRIRQEDDKILLDLGPAPELSDQNGTALVRLPGSQVPDIVTKLALMTKTGWAAIDGSLQSGNEPDPFSLGSKLRFLAFESGGVNACSKGQLRVRYAGETYTFDTPIPGCPKP